MPKSLFISLFTVVLLSTVGAQQVTRPTRDLPLEPTRTLSLDTDEGSWMSLDVSPDGRTISPARTCCCALGPR